MNFFRRKRGVVGALILAALAFLAGCGGSGFNVLERRFPLSSLQRATLTVSGTPVNVYLNVYLMDTPAKREEGMMYLSSSDIGAHDGMLFVFPDTAPRAFYMKDTSIPLDIAYLDTSGVVINTAPLKPFDLTPVYSGGSAQYALEVKQGSLASWGVVAGTQIVIPQSIHANQ